MDCKEFREFYSHSSGNDVPENYSKHIKDCSSCRTFMKAFAMIENSDQMYKSPPDNLEEKCLDALKAAGQKKNSITIKMKYLAAAAVLIVVLTVSVTLSVVSINSDDNVIVYLSLYAPEAELVSVVGDWNDWKPEADLLHDRDKDGEWEIKLEIIPGKEYRYQFLVNGEMRLPDPDSRFTINDGFGGENSILDI